MESTLDKLLQEQLESLTVEGKEALLEFLRSLRAWPGAAASGRLPSLLELDGLGKECWEGIDAEAHVRAERESWERR